ncbi:acyl-CoA dehydrogenase family protein [Halomonas sp. HK25]|uniref:acyl-CoA dehydrogenase family protein n=1 Tax=Halomonas sp. HK25 TaxID=3394321 RepID=UPI0039FBB90F
MDFTMSEEQQAIAEMARGLFDDHSQDEALQRFDASGEPWLAPLWEACIETGLHSLLIPDAQGGSGLGMIELMWVLQAQGESLGPAPLWRHQLAATLLATFGDSAEAPLVEAAAAGHRLLTLGGIDAVVAQRPCLSAQAHPDGWTLAGTLAAVPYAEQAALIIVPLALPDGMRLAWLDPNSSGLALRKGVMAQGEPVCDLECDGVVIGHSQLLPETALDWLRPRAVAALAALQLGVSEAQLRHTVAYIAERRQFDQRIGSFQAVQMSMADARIDLETLRSTLWQLCYRLDAGLSCDAEAASVAWFACEAGHRIGHRAQHVHGGVGVDITYPIHRYLYWSRVLGSELGGGSAVLDALGQWLAEHDTLGWKYDLEEHSAS